MTPGEAARTPATITLQCTTPKCPRTRKVPREDYDPPTATVAVLPCPWHDESGSKDSGETYYDAQGNEVFQHG